MPENLTGCRIIDLGGGAAEIAVLLQQRGAVVDFFDLDAHNVQRAGMLGLKSIQADLNQHLNFAETGVYDGIVLLEVIEHVFQAEQLLNETRRLLRPNGFLLLSTPNIAHLNRRFKTLLGAPPSDEGYHCRFFTVKTLYNQLRSAGFRVVAANHATSTFGLNRVLRTVRRPPLRFAFSPKWHNLFARHIILLART